MNDSLKETTSRLSDMGQLTQKARDGAAAASRFFLRILSVHERAVPVESIQFVSRVALSISARYMKNGNVNILRSSRNITQIITRKTKIQCVLLPERDIRLFRQKSDGALVEPLPSRGIMESLLSNMREWLRSKKAVVLFAFKNQNVALYTWTMITLRKLSEIYCAVLVICSSVTLRFTEKESLC